MEFILLMFVLMLVVTAGYYLLQDKNSLESTQNEALSTVEEE